MLTRLGAGALAEDSVGLLLECHDRIRTFTKMAARLAAAHGAGPEEIRETARRVGRYFAEALPLHVRDEEESILPRLRGHSAEVDRALELMAREHREHEASLARVLAACAALEEDPAALAELAGMLAGAAAELQELFARHLALEEEVVFPALRRVLSAEGDAEVVRELRGRRARADR